ncbi:MAG: carbohydrate-binding domain-containing protein [Chloroflexi bacterium]|nr:carbohydrate-binding domain-containing protein [Chloroflexota bacterium]
MTRKSILPIAILLVVLSALALGSASAQSTLDVNPTIDTTLTLDGTSITVDGSGVAVSGSTAVIDAAGTYRLTGTLSDGQIVVDTDDDGLVTLVLDGVTLNSSTSAPIYVKEADSAAILLVDGTQNVVTDAFAYIYETAEDNEPNAAVFSDDPLTIYGSGTLTVTGNYGDGIASKDTLTIYDAIVAVTAADDGIRGKDSVLVAGAQITVNAQGDGVKSDNEEDALLGTITIESGEFDIVAGGDAFQAQTVLTIADGTFSLTVHGGSRANISADASAKGLKADVSVVVNGGSFTINTADDAVHSNGSITINGGTLNLATGDDAIHAETEVLINGGTIQITESYEGLEGTTVTINGGDIHIVSSDDGINVGVDGMGGGRGAFVSTASGAMVAINGGYTAVYAEGDGIDANGSIVMTNGTLIINGPTGNMNGSLDYDGSFQLTGGTLLAVGSAGMMQAPDTSSTQYTLVVGFNNALQAGTLINIQNSAGQSVLTFAPAKTYQSIVYSAPSLVAGETYTINQGGSASGTATDGLYDAASYSAGSPYTTLTLSSVISQAGVMGGFGGRRGRP